MAPAKYASQAQALKLMNWRNCTSRIHRDSVWKCSENNVDSKDSPCFAAAMIRITNLRYATSSLFIERQIIAITLR